MNDFLVKVKKIAYHDRFYILSFARLSFILEDGSYVLRRIVQGKTERVVQSRAL